MQVPFSMDERNVKLMHECCPQTITCMGTARMK